MNTPQQILTAVLRSPRFQLFKSGISPHEVSFIERLRASRYYQNLEIIENSKNGRCFMTWQCSSGEFILCPISDSKFYFSGIAIYAKKKRSRKDKQESEFSEPLSVTPVIKAEIKEIKEIFLEYSKNAGMYFK